MVIGGIAGFIEAHSHAPGEACRKVFCLEGETRPTGLSRTVYDLLRIGAWALVILGGLTVILGVIRYSADARHRH